MPFLGVGVVFGGGGGVVAVEGVDFVDRTGLRRFRLGFEEIGVGWQAGGGAGGLSGSWEGC